VTTKQKALRIVGNNPNPTLPAQGSDGTVVITGSSPGGSLTAYFLAYEATSINVEISNLTFVQAGTGSENPSSGGGFVFVSHVVGGKPVSFHHNTYITHQCGPTRGIATTYNRGVYWRNKFLGDVPLSGCGWNTTTGALALYPNVTDGTALWNSPSTLGALDVNGDQHLYFETNYMENLSIQALDYQDGARIVVRYNTFVDSSHANHGHDSGPIGARQFEIYNNTFVLTDRGLDTANLGRWILVRGGTGVITDNIIPVLNVPAFGGILPNVHLTLFALWTDQCYRGTYPWLHQIGWGWDGSLDIHGNPEVLDRLYYWNNRVAPGGALAAGMIAAHLVNTCSTPPPPITDFLLAGRDYFNDADAPNGRPGYVKYQYPHPLTSSPPPGAPSNLQVR
jgi:hypothetical protein